MKFRAAILLLSFLVTCVVAFVVWRASGGHVFLFPLILLFGIPFFGARGRR